MGIDVEGDEAERIEAIEGHDIPVIGGEDGRARHVGSGARPQIGHTREHALTNRGQQSRLPQALEERVGVAAAHEERVGTGERVEGAIVPAQVQEIERRPGRRRGREEGLEPGEGGGLVVHARRGDEGDVAPSLDEVGDLPQTFRPEEEAAGMQEGAHQGVYVSRSRRSCGMDFTI